jgi:hypothetical protein
MDKQIDRSEWPTFADHFSTKNEKRLVTIEVLSAELGDEFFAEGSPFMALDYDSKEREALLISVGESESPSTHIISDPGELWVEKNEAGDDLALEVVSDAGRTIVRFLPEA